MIGGCTCPACPPSILKSCAADEKEDVFLVAPDFNRLSCQCPEHFCVKKMSNAQGK